MNENTMKQPAPIPEKQAQACTGNAPPELVIKNLAANASPSSVPTGLYCTVNKSDRQEKQ